MMPAKSGPFPSLSAADVGQFARVFILKKETERRAYYFTGVMRFLEMEGDCAYRDDGVVSDAGFLPGDAYPFANQSTAEAIAKFLNAFGAIATAEWQVVEVGPLLIGEEAL